MRLLLLLLSITCSGLAVEPEERERLHGDLSQGLSELAEAHERLGATAASGGIAIPPGVPVTLTARRMLGDEWLTRVKAPAEFPVEEVDIFREEINGIRARLDLAIQQIEQLTSAADRWPRSVDTPEFQRYRTFLRSRAEQALLEIAAGGDQAVDEELHWRRQRRHEIILQLIESDPTTERWSLVPKDSPALREYLELRVSLRTAAETGLQQAMPANDRDLDRDENILWLLDELVSLVQNREERRTHREIPPTAPLLPAYHAALTAEEQSLRAQIAHRRATIVDEGAWYREEDALRRERDQRNRLSNLAWEGLEIDLTIAEQRRNIEERMMDAPVAVRVALGTRLTALDQQRTASTTRLGKALESGSRVEALQARSALRMVLRDHEAAAEEFEWRRDREENEKEWRLRASEPGVADALAKLDAAWTAIEGVRTRQVEADHAAIRSELARELAEVEAEVAQLAAERSRQEMDQAREALDLSRQRVIDVLENPPPKPEGDVKF